MSVDIAKIRFRAFVDDLENNASMDEAGDAGIPLEPVSFRTEPQDAYPALILSNDNLISYWRLGESSGVVAYDMKDGYDGTYIDCPRLNMRGAVSGDTAIALNGTTQYVYVPGGSSYGNAFTYEMWVKPGYFGYVYRGLISKGWGSGHLRFNYSGYLELGKQGVALIATSTVAVGSGWHHVVATKAGSSTHLYIDSVDVTGSCTDNTCEANSQALCIGACPEESSFANCFLDEVAIYSAALIPAQILEHYMCATREVSP